MVSYSSCSSDRSQNHVGSCVGACILVACLRVPFLSKWSHIHWSPRQARFCNAFGSKGVRGPKMSAKASSSGVLRQDAANSVQSDWCFGAFWCWGAPALASHSLSNFAYSYLSDKLPLLVLLTTYLKTKKAACTKLTGIRLIDTALYYRTSVPSAKGAQVATSSWLPPMTL